MFTAEAQAAANLIFVAGFSTAERVTMVSEPESFSAVAERRAKTPRIQAQTTAIARAMARICNDETRCFGVQGGHGGKTLRLSGRGVGMDAVQSAVRALGGDVSIRFEDDRTGADYRQFSMLVKVPASLAVNFNQ